MTADRAKNRGEPDNGKRRLLRICLALAGCLIAALILLFYQQSEGLHGSLETEQEPERFGTLGGNERTGERPTARKERPSGDQNSVEKYQLLYKESVRKDAESNSELKYLLDLRDSYSKDRTNELEPMIDRIRDWLNSDAPSEIRLKRQLAHRDLQDQTELLGLSYEWTIPDLKAVMKPGEVIEKRFASSLLKQGIDLDRIVEETGSMESAVQSIQALLEARIRETVSASGAPPDLYPERLVDLMTRDIVERRIAAKIYELSSAESKNLAEQGRQLRSRRIANTADSSAH
jgi:hypothetical protein